MDKVEVLNLVPKFLSFYNLANKPDIDDEERWALWEEHYNFAAVSPGVEGRKIARNWLDENWERCADHLSFIEEWKDDEKNVRECLT